MNLNMAAGEGNTIGVGWEAFHPRSFDFCRKYRLRARRSAIVESSAAK
jgi:hypothetical protein